MDELIPSPAFSDAAPPPAAPAAGDPSPIRQTTPWRTYLEAARSRRQQRLEYWKQNVNYRVQRPFGGDPQATDQSSALDRVAIPEDWSRTKQKTAQLSYQLPKILATAKRPEYRPAEALVTAVVNDRLECECRAAYVVDECLADVVNAAGLMVMMVGVSRVTQPVQIPMPRPPLGSDPTTGAPVPDPRPPLVQTIDVPIATRFTMDRVSPALFLYPEEFTGSDWDKAPWLGYDTYLPVAVVRRRWRQAIPDTFRAQSVRPKLLSDDVREQTHTTDGEYVRVTFLWYRAAQFDEDATHPDHLRTQVFVEGVDEPVESGECDWQQWVPAQPAQPAQPPPPGPPTTGSSTPAPGPAAAPSRLLGSITPGYFKGLTKFPLRVQTLTYVSDLAVPPSDSAAGRSQVRELMRSHSQMIRQRDSSIPIRWFDVNRLDPQVIAAMQAGEWQDMIPVNGPGERVVGEVARANYPRENFQFQSAISSDLDRAWSLSNNQLSTANETTRSATEIAAMSSANQIRLDYEKGRVSRWITDAAEVLFSLMQVFVTDDSYVQVVGTDGAKILQQVTQDSIAGAYGFTFKADSSDRVDTVTAQNNALKAYNLLANSPSINRAALERKVIEVLGFDPSELIGPPPPPPGPKPPNITYSFKGEDLLNPMAVAVMLKAGHDLGPNDIKAAATMIQDSLKQQRTMQEPPQPPTEGGGPPPAAAPKVEPPQTQEPILARTDNGDRMV